MSKVVFFFAGTGDDGEKYTNIKESKCDFQDDVIRIYIKGCQEERVGNGFLFPDLEIAANNVRNAFEGTELNLDKLKENFGDSLYTIRGETLDNKITIDDITLEGFSRGAITTFATAKKLDDLNIPIHIIANQPVPGELGITKRLYSKYGDLTGCRNIKSAHTFLASYNLEQGLIHNHFFRQMIAKFAPEVKAQEILFPHQHHRSWFKNSPIHIHINKLMAENGLTDANDDELRIKKWYKRNSDSYFTPHEFMQTIYGAKGHLSKDPVYLSMLVENATELLSKSNVEVLGTINPEQAAAIIAIADLADDHMNDETKIKLYDLLLKNSQRAEQFVKIINKVTEVCNYLPYATHDNISNKSNLIATHANDYKKSIFLESFEFLSKDKPDVQDKKHFASTIYKAECNFREKALGIDRSMMRMVLKVLTNFITHITGVGLIINTINKAKTGNWLLFQHNRSENAVRDTRKALLGDIDKLDADSDQNKDNNSDFKPSNL